MGKSYFSFYLFLVAAVLSYPTNQQTIAMMMIHDNKPFITAPTDVMNHPHHHLHQQQQQDEDRSFPSFVKQIFTSLSCLQPTNASQGGAGGLMKKEQDEQDKHAARMYLATAADSFPDSVFLKMYFSFPALEDFDGSSSMTSSKNNSNKKKNSPSSAAVEQCKRLLR